MSNTLLAEIREFPPVGIEPEASRLPDECPDRLDSSEDFSCCLSHSMPSDLLPKNTLSC